jgi:hypothetical protein
LTYDRRLTIFSVFRADANQQPFCLLPGDWLQLTRPFLPRTDDYERSFVALLSHPLLYQESKKDVPFDHVVGALNRLERYQELPVALVANMVTDGAFVQRLRAANNERDARRVIELETKKLAGKVAEDNTHLKAQLANTNTRVDRLEGHLKELKTENGSLAEQRQQAVSEGRQLSKRLEEAEAAAAKEVERVRVQASGEVSRVTADAASQLDLLRHDLATMRRWGLFGLCLIVGVVVAVPLLMRVMPSFSPVQQLVAIGWLLISILMLLGIPFRRQPFAIISVVSFVIGVLGLLGLSYQLWGQ